MHPALRILLYVLSAMALPWLNHFMLASLGLVSIVFTGRRWPTLLRLLRRARWIFLLLGLGYAYSQPGEGALAWMGEYSPSWPGVQAGLGQMLRLLVLLVLLDGLVLSMGPERLLIGLHGLLQSLGRLGFPVERMTVRLALTLEAMQAPRRDRLELTDLLSTAQDPAGPPGETYSLSRHPWRAVDSLALLVGLLLLAWVWRSA